MKIIILNQIHFSNFPSSLISTRSGLRVCGAGPEATGICGGLWVCVGSFITYYLKQMETGRGKYSVSASTTAQFE
jgi:hypothetical protein